MTKTFENYPDLTSDMAFALISRLKGRAGLNSEFGMSNQSCSAYVNITAYDAEDEYLGEFKVRFSDHVDRHGADITVRIDDLAETVTDDDGDHVEVSIADHRYEDAMIRAEQSVAAFIEAL
ncbi:hypothetical protein [Brevundimonas nasdae]|uniref:hypothetical protein n=1 Tax=Brevundimonas nasdae TaxID=172043 RepID=UPI003F6934C3